MYPLNMKPIQGKPSICLLTKAFLEDSWLWHRRLSHLDFKDINKLVIGDHVRGLSLLKFEKKSICVQLAKWDNKAKKFTLQSLILKLLSHIILNHIDLCGASSIDSIGGNYLGDC